MPKQLSFESGGFQKYKKKTRREKFLEEMESAVPWKKLLKVIEPFYHPSPGPQGGRPPAGLPKMFRIHCLQHWFNLSDPGVEDALHESPVLRRFVGIDLGVEPVPDETTIMRFRHLLEENGLSKDLFQAVNDTLRRKGLMLKKGTIVDATIIDAPSSTKNEAKERDPEMCQTKKGNQWNVFRAGHQIRLTSNFSDQRATPRHDPPPQVTVHFGGDKESALILPVIPTVDGTIAARR
jgi:transposase, IS5 family